MATADAFALPGGFEFNNRIAKSAMTEGLAARDGLPNQGHVRLYQRWAQGGAGLLITGNVVIDRQHRERPGNVVIDGPLRPAAMAAWKEWAAAATANGTQCWVQLSHAGRQTPIQVNNTPKAPSAVRLQLPGGMFGVPIPLHDAEIVEIIARFVNAAEIARAAGFTGVQIHAAHGYLISQFLSPLANRRSDRWGGSLENRARLLTEIIKAVRLVVGQNFGVGVKLNSADFQKGGFQFSDCLTVAGWLQDLGVDLLELSGGTYEQPAMMDMEGMQAREMPPQQASTSYREAYFVDLAKALLIAKTPPLLVTGGFRTLQAMESAIAAGIAMVGVARPLCCAPEAVADMLAGHLDELPRFEDALRVGPGWLGPQSPFRIVRAVNGFAAQAWYYQQLRRVAAGEPILKRLNPVKAFLAENREAKARI